MLDLSLSGLPAYAVAALPLIGAFGGVIAGMVGSGGGVLVLPLLIYIALVPMKMATGISAAQYFLASLSAVLAHRRSRNVDLRVGLVMLGTGVVFAQAGAVLSAFMTDLSLTLLYFVLAAGAATSLLFPARAERPGVPTDRLANPNWVAAAAMGVLVGLVDGILGVGGGFLMVPLLIYALGMPTRLAIGTSLFVIAGTMASAVVGKLIQGQVPLLPSVLVTAGAVVGAQVGARLSGRFPPAVLRKMLSGLIYLVCIRMVVDVWSQVVAS